MITYSAIRLGCTQVMWPESYSLKEINFFTLFTKKVEYIHYIERCIAGKNCTFRKLSKITFITLPQEQQFELRYGGETVTLVFQMRILP